MAKNLTSIRSLAAIAAGLLFCLSACTNSSDSAASGSAASDVGVAESGEPSSTTVLATLDSLEEGESAYELETSFLGEQLRRILVLPSPIGRTQTIDVRIESGESWVAATIDVVVERSQASGESDTIRLSLVSADASDPGMAEGLSASIGGSLLAVRGRHHVVEQYDWSALSGDSSAASDSSAVSDSGAVSDSDAGSPEQAQVRFWLQQLLQAPVAFAGPIPDVALGEGAVWKSRFVAADGKVADNRHTLARLDSDRYLIQVENEAQDASHSILLEGSVGDPIPDRQEVAIGDIVTTISARS